MYQRKARVYYENGTLEYKGDIVDGQFHTEIGESYYRNGNKEYNGKFVNGGFEGEACRVYHKNGKLWYVGQMANKMFDGYGKLYDSGGNLEFAGLFQKGKPNDDQYSKQKTYKNREKEVTEKIMNVLQTSIDSPKKGKYEKHFISDKN